MNNVNMAGMNAIGGPVGGAMPMMNNGAAAAGGARQPMPVNDNQRSQLNTYIYEYFLRNGMFDCARSLLNSDQPMNVLKESPGRRRDGDGSGGADDGDGDSKDDIDSKRPDDLPLPNLPKECPESCFLYEWWCLFWDMFNAQRGKGDGRAVLQYVNHTQTQSRMRQEQQQGVLRGMRNEMIPQNYQMMMRNQPNGMSMHQQQSELRQKAIQNNRNATPQMLAQQQKQNQNQMQRDPSGGETQRPQSPGSAENAPSPSKRPRLDGTPFNPQQMQNGRGQAQGMPQQVGNTGPSNAIQAAHMQLTNGIEPENLTAQQFQVPGGANANAQSRSLAGYQAGLAQQQAGQMPVKPMQNQGGPQNQGSPMMTQGQDGGNIANYYNPTEMNPNGIRGGPGGQANGTGGNHALQDYQMQLMLLEQQNKKRLMMARQEQDSIPRPDGSTGPGAPGAQAIGPNGQPFQGASPQGARSANSPNPSEQMKRGTPHMNPTGMSSPLPEGQSRGSPSGMNFNLPGGPMDPSNMNSKFYQMNGMDPNMVGGAMPNGMRPPSSHPGGGFNNAMTPQQQQMVLARQQQQQAQQQQAAGQNWQPGPNGQMVPPPGQGPPQQNMGTPRQGAMPPPSAPAAAGATTNGRAQPPSPQQGTAAPPTPQQANKANPKKKNEAKDNKKRPTKKPSAANLTAGATPSADAPADGPTPTPQTPMTPVHNKQAFNGQNGAVPPAANGQPSVPAANTGAATTQQPDSLQVNNYIGEPYGEYAPLGPFADPGTGSLDVLQDFDFDSFLHQDTDDVNNFTFDTFAMEDGGQIGAE